MAGPAGFALPEASTSRAATRYGPSVPMPSGTNRLASAITAVRKSDPLTRYSTRCPAANGRLIASVASLVTRSLALRPVSRTSASETPAAHTRRGSMASMESVSDSSLRRTASCTAPPDPPHYERVLMEDR